MTTLVPSAERAAEQSTVDTWLSDLEAALADGDAEAIASLFTPDGSWRDLLALTWELRTFSGTAAIASGWHSALASGRAEGLHFGGVAHLEEVDRFGRRFLLARFDFTSPHASGRGVVRLVSGGGSTRPLAWTLLTAIETVDGLVERNGVGRPRGTEYSRTFAGPNWLDLRSAATRYDDHEPQVLVVGGGQAGLAVAARLGQMGIDTLVVDRYERVGDNWRKRYHSLTLHNVVWTNDLPYLPFPPTFPVYIPKDMLADWMESYARIMELNVWTATEFVAARYVANEGHWEVDVRTADGERRLHPRHVIVATGVSGIPRMPDLPGLGDFAGEVLHSSAFVDGSAYAGKRALVIGTGTSGHDAAQDLYESGAEVTIVQRSPTTVLSIEPSAVRFYSLYHEGANVADADLLTVSNPYELILASARQLTEEGERFDAELLEGLHARGFRTDTGEDGTGWQLKYLRYGGGYYFDVGCSRHIVEGRIALRQAEELDGFDERGARLRGGGSLPLDLVVLATGYRPMTESIAAMFGEQVAASVGDVWGFDAEGEMNNLWRQTPQPGLWFTMGSLAQARIFSKFLALQIWAIEAGRGSNGLERAAANARPR